ncbi:MAG: DUF885 domain-containing protein [Proteobacteria bacterium]|nr:DUF885 domain-containing protein [Pseudomonadota bacterium]
MRNFVAGLLVLGLTLGLAACEPAPAPDEAGDAAAAAEIAAAALDVLITDEWANRLVENPAFASSMGVTDYNGKLPMVAAEDHARRLLQDEAFLARLEAIARTSLGEENQLNYDLLGFVLRDRVARASWKPWRVPFSSDSGFHTWLTRMADSMPFRTAADYENYISRLGAIPAYFEQNIANMRQGLADGFTMPRAILGGLVPTMSAQVKDSAGDSAFFKPFLDFPETMSEETRERLARAGRAVIEQAVMPAYGALHEFFMSEYIPGARQTLGAYDLPDGESYYRYLVRYFTTLDMTPEEVHELGLSEVARIRAEMEAIIRDVGFKGSFADFLQFLRTDPRFYAKTPDDLLREAAFIAKKIDGQLPAFFGRLPRMPYGVEPVPASIAPNYTTGRYLSAPEGGRRGGLYWVNTYALDKRPLYVLPSLTLHEAVPGHHLQISLAREMEGVPDFRRVLYPNAFGEGWGLYAEKLGLEMGMYDDPYANFGRLTYEMWRAGRLVVDTGIHAMGWTRQQAVDLFVRNSALSIHNINTEVDRYISWPGQALSYKMGELTILRLRAKAEAALGEDFDIRGFHDAVLAAGGIPMGILEARIDTWIMAQIEG